MKVTSIFPSFLILLTCLLYAACTKTDNPGNNSFTGLYKVKTIHYRPGKGSMLEDTTIYHTSQAVDSFIYDNNNRLIIRYLVYHNFDSKPPVYTVDTSTKFYYYYSSATSNIITSYTERCTSDTNRSTMDYINHLLKYDASNRLILDSTLNPTHSNNKTTSMVYTPNGLIEKNDGWYDYDTLIFSNNVLIREQMNGNRSIQYVMSNVVNPFSYINNFSLWKSDYQNDLGVFLNYVPFSRCSYLPSYVSGSSPGYQENYSIIPTLDSLGRVIISTVIFGGSYEKTTYEYY